MLLLGTQALHSRVKTVNAQLTTQSPGRWFHFISELSTEDQLPFIPGGSAQTPLGIRVWSVLLKE